jgi:hypothetical protein
MVKIRLLILALLCIMGISTFIGSATAQIQFHLNREWVQIWINQDGTIDLMYNMSITCDSLIIRWVTVGQPNNDFTIGQAQDNAGHVLSASATGQGTVNVTLYSPISTGQTTEFSLLTNVGGMVQEDTQNPGNVGMQFIPTWYDAPINDLRVLIYLPPGVPQDKIKTSVNWDNISNSTGLYAVYWERQNLAPNQNYTFGVSFPAEYVQNYVRAPTFWQQYGLLIIGTGVFAIAIGAAVYVLRKRPYHLPTISMETLGVRHGLTAVEASYLLDLKPTQIVTEILYSLLQKRAVWVESTTPSIKLKVMEAFKDTTETQETPLRYYEIDFLGTIKEDGALDEERLAQSVMYLRDAVEEELHGYCRRDTIDYYRKIVDKAWTQVEQAGTPELASKAYDEQLLWLFLDPEYRSRTEKTFQSTIFQPSPLWFWYWYGYQHYAPNPTYAPNVQNPAQSAKPPTIPGAEFANNIATAVENTANNIVVNMERFANAIIPLPAAGKASREPAHHEANCVCACAACACACACVSCACACAGGGVG